ncbi:Putative L-alanine-DL-glutamate epimerase [Sodalis praecaptivus]|uniref:Putative L-alanine-DL-glutamate epimerase n=1 Tax=Sodalis praecaptivus TaxID=1239307 RepID=W0I1N6_9GAMM|nr:mandelate racemase/muconate lactonizing enzyme family protein [Sodalis praecaptivus]AHF78368.1 Putative L-alanine-DL-glutamate epimerase [Sodalis praecaptivus]
MSNSHDRPDEIRIDLCRISEKTCWLFISIRTRSGLQGVGEATLSGREKEVLALFGEVASALLNAPGRSPRAHFPDMLSLPLAALISACDQALWDIQAQAQALPLCALLSPEPAREISVYANINRRTGDRSAAGFAVSALDAIACGHTAIKIAPFDEVDCRRQRPPKAVAALQKGIERIDRVRDAIGEDIRLMVDCHWRLDVPTVQALLPSIARYRLYWLECPLPESHANLDELVAIKAQANAQHVLLAGCEENIRTESFAPFWDKRVYDVYMPDAKYVGGIEEMMAVAAHIQQQGATFSPHNPSGPVCDAVSAHVCAAVAGAGMLEMQFDETPLFSALIGGETKAVERGKVALSPRPGLGVTLDRALVEKYALTSQTVKRGS